MSSETSRKLKYLNWIFTIGIVIYHTYPAYKLNVVTTSAMDNFIAKLYLFFSDRLGYISLTFFFFISGFLLYNNTKTFKHALKKIRKRFCTLLIPFLLWNTIYSVLRVLSNKPPLPEFLRHIYVYYFLEPCIGPAWYLLALLLLLTLYIPLALTQKNKVVSFVAFFSLATYFAAIKYTSFNAFFNPQTWWWYDVMLNYLSVYFIGSFFGLNYPQIILDNKYDNIKFRWLGAALIVLSIVLFCTLHQRMFLVLFSVILLTGIWLLLKSNIFKKDLPKFLDAAFFIYMMHRLILIFLDHAVSIILPSDSVSGITIVVINICSVLIIPVISCMTKAIMEKILPKKIFYMFSGGR